MLTTILKKVLMALDRRLLGKRLRTRLLRSPRLYDLYFRHFKDVQQGSIRGRHRVPKRREGAPHCLVFAKRHWTFHTALEVLFAKQRQAEGWHVTMVGCDRALDTCDHMHYGLGKPNCNHCALMLRQFARRCGIEYVSMREYLKEHAPQPAAPRDYARITHVSWIRLIRSLRPVEAGELQLRDDLIRNAAMVDQFISHYLDHQRVDEVVMVNGKFFAEQLIREHCLERQIPYLAYERGAVKETVMFGRNRAAIPADTADLWTKYRDVPLSDNERTRLADYLEERKVVGNAEKVAFYETLDEDAAAFFAQTGLRSHGRLTVLFTNTIWDSSTVDEDTIFRDMFEWIETTVEFFARHPERQLAIRVHPVEVRVQASLRTRDRVDDRLAGAFRELPPNVRIILPEENVSPYLLMDLAELGLVYCSTTGMEMVMRNKPVIVASTVHYRDPGMVYLPKDGSEYLDLLERVPEPLTRQVELMERYANMYYFHHMRSYADVMRLDPVGGFRYTGDIENAGLLPHSAGRAGD